MQDNPMEECKLTSNTYEHMLKPQILKVPIGCDLLQSLKDFCKRYQSLLNIYTAEGMVDNVTICQPTEIESLSYQPLCGRFEIQGLCGFCSDSDSSLVICMGDSEGQVVVGLVCNDSFLEAASPITITAAPFKLYLDCHNQNDTINPKYSDE
ncbi:hypothetical protein SUGI_0211530 [Cryptomeria japonica]|nr:hypothetical protein SUGI_0211530 [Cryptomeria japonica]